jgi:hypothetical protein
MPIGDSGAQSADARAMELAQLIYPEMLAYFPPKEKAGS